MVVQRLFRAAAPCSLPLIGDIAAPPVVPAADLNSLSDPDLKTLTVRHRFVAHDTIKPGPNLNCCCSDAGRAELHFLKGLARYNARMYTPQAGIFALGTSSHAYLN